jgi:hypothetical protein
MACANGTASAYLPARPSSAILALCAARPCADDGVPRQALIRSDKPNFMRLRGFMITVPRGPALGRGKTRGRSILLAILLAA